MMFVHDNTPLILFPHVLELSINGQPAPAIGVDAPLCLDGDLPACLNVNHPLGHTLLPTLFINRFSPPHGPIFVPTLALADLELLALSYNPQARGQESLTTRVEAGCSNRRNIGGRGVCPC